MKPQRTLENKQKFFAQYWGQRIGSIVISENDQRHDYEIGIFKGIHYINLIPLSMISDEDAIEVARLSTQNGHKWKLTKRDRSMIHLEYTDRYETWHHVGIDSQYATICTNKRFEPLKGENSPTSFDVSIGRIHSSSRKPVPYIAVVDLLRSKGYALPWMGISVEQQVEAGWVKLKTGLS